MSHSSRPPLLAQCGRYAEQIAITDEQGAHPYVKLLQQSSTVAAALLAGREDLQDERIAFAVTPGFAWVATLWGIWRVGGVAVPLPLSSPTPELEYFIDDSGASTLVGDVLALPLLSQFARSRDIRALAYDELCTCQAEHPHV